LDFDLASAEESAVEDWRIDIQRENIDAKNDKDNQSDLENIKEDEQEDEDDDD